MHDDPDSSASRAYYAAFHAISAYFTSLGKSFSKHSALESAIYKEFIKTGLWPVEIGKNFSWLMSTRSTGDYGGGMHVSEEDAVAAVEKAREIIGFVNMQNPAIFNL